MAGNKANTKPLTNTDTGLSVLLDLPVYGAPSRAGGGNAMRFLIPRDGTVPFPGLRKVPRQAGSRIPFPVPC